MTVEKGNVDFSANYGCAIYSANTKEGAVSSVTIKEGNVAAHNGSSGISASSNSKGKNIVTVAKGTVESENIGINTHSVEGGQSTVAVQGDIYGGEIGISTYSNNDGSSSTAIAHSDVKAGDNGTGLYLANSTDATGMNNILVEGTVSGGTAITLYDGDTTASNSTVTVWAAESKGEGKGLVTMENSASEDAIDAFTKAINYIVKLSGSLTNDNVSTAKGKTVSVTEENEIKYGDTSETYKYHTANEEEDVTLSFQLQEGEALDGVYYNAEDKDTEGKIKEGENLLTVGQGLTKQEDGSVLLKMLRGG